MAQGFVDSLSGCRTDVAKQVAPRFLIELRLERELVFERRCAQCRRSSADSVEKTLQMPQVTPCVVTENEWHGTCPSPNGHIDDRILVPQHVRLLCKLIVEDIEVASRFVIIPLRGIVESLRRKVLEMHRLAGIRTDAGRD